MKTIYFRCVADFEEEYQYKDCQTIAEVMEFYKEMKNEFSYKIKRQLIHFEVFQHEVSRVTNQFYMELKTWDRD